MAVDAEGGHSSEESVEVLHPREVEPTVEHISRDESHYFINVIILVSLLSSLGSE